MNDDSRRDDDEVTGEKIDCGGMQVLSGLYDIIGNIVSFYVLKIV